MSLTILQNENTIILEGPLNSSTLNYFKSHFNNALNTLKNLTLDIDKVTEIDAAVMTTLKDMYKKAVISNNIFFVVGNGCKEIYEDFQYPQVA